MAEKVVILGSGITGLTAAWELQKKFGDQVQITILEKKERPGGWIQSSELGKHFFELGPRSLRPHGAGILTLKMISELGLNDKVLTPHESAASRYLWYKGALRKIPGSFVEFIKSPWIWPAGVGLVLSFFKKKPEGDLSIHEYFSMRYGNFAADVLADALVAGIYAGDPKKLSMRACFPNFGNKEEKSDLNAPLFTLEGGLEALTKRLVERLDVQWSFSTEALSIDERGVHTTCGFFEADQIISALPAFALDAVTQYQIPTLKKFKSLSLGVVSVGWNQKVLPVEGFGYLIPRSEDEGILGIVFDSSTFPFQNRHDRETRLTVMLPEIEEKKALAEAKNALFKHLNISQPPEVVHFTPAKNALPQYGLGHREDVEEFVAEARVIYPTLTALGSSFYGVAVNDCIRATSTLLESFALKREQI